MLGLRYAFKEALIGIRHAKTMTALALGTIALSLLVFGLFLLVTISLYGAVRSVKARIEMEVYLETHRSPKEALVFKQEIEKIAGIQSVRYISKDEAAVEFTKVFGDSLLVALSENPLPTSLRIVPAPEFRTAEKMAQIARNIRSYDVHQLIDDIHYGASWVREFDLLLQGIVVMDLFLGAVVGLASILVVSNAVRLSVLARREVIEIMKLVGASDGFVRMPFFLEGLLEGMLGGTLAAIALYFVSLWAFQLFYAPRSIDHFSFMPSFPGIFSASIVAGAFVLIPIGALLGAVGSLLSLRRVLTDFMKG